MAWIFLIEDPEAKINAVGVEGILNSFQIQE